MKLLRSEPLKKRLKTVVNKFIQEVGVLDSERLEKITGEFCDRYCKYPCKTKNQDELDEICESCPMNELADLLD